MLAAVEADWRTAPVSDRVRAILEFLTKFVPHNGNIDRAAIQKLKTSGLSKDEIVEAMNVSWCFINVSKWADALDFPITPPEKFKSIGKNMYKYGYKSVSVPPPF